MFLAWITCYYLECYGCGCVSLMLGFRVGFVGYLLFELFITWAVCGCLRLLFMICDWFTTVLLVLVYFMFT